MQHLPFLVVYGALVWKVVVALGGLGGVGLLRRRARTRERRIVARSIELYGNASSAPLEGAVVLRGHLRGGTVTTHTGRERHGGPLAHTKTDGVWLDVGGDRIDVPGDAAVIRGTSARATGVPGAQRWFTLADGDEVIALGTCARRTHASEETYRDATGGWVMTPLPHRTTVELLAATPVIVPRALGPVRGALVVAISAFAMYLTLALVGPIVAAISDTAAAATPVGRDIALGKLESRAMVATDPDVRMTRYDVIELRSGCAAAFEAMYQDGLLERALATAQRCDLADGEARTLLQLGYYEDARPTADGNDELIADVGAGRWSEAAATFRGTTTRTRCVLELLRFRAGDRDARSLDALAVQTQDPLCTAYAAHRTPPIALDAVTAYDQLARDLPHYTIDVDPEPDTAAAALLAFYRGDFDTARQIAAGVRDPRLQAIIDERTGHPQAAYNLPTELDPSLVRTLTLFAPESVFHDVANVDPDARRALSPALHAMTFRPSHGADLPAAMIREAALRRDLARLAGELDYAAYWQHVIDRHLKMLADPDRRALVMTAFGD